METDLNKRTIYIHNKGKTPLPKALEIITEDWLESEECCHKTIIDIVSALKIAVIRLDILRLRKEL